MVKRLADWLEKMSVAALAVGLFQGQVLGFVIGAGCFALTMWITKREAGK